MAAIEVKLISSDAAASVFDVRVAADGGQTEFKVAVSQADSRRLAGGKLPPEELVRRSFEFLLEREPAGSILRRFALKDISRYFPEYEAEMDKL